MYLMLASCCDDEAYLLLVMDANALILQKQRMRVRESTSPSTIEEVRFCHILAQLQCHAYNCMPGLRSQEKRA